MNAAGSPPPVFSVVIPCRNEEANVRQIGAAVVAEMEAIGDSFELIFIDNASDDETVPLLREMCARDPRIKLIANARNFGQLRSPAHGIYSARGRAVISLCADFQDPPEMIGPFVERWRAGADLVFGVRVSERGSLLLRTWRDLSYAFAARFGDYPIIPNATGFGLYDRRVVRQAAAMNEPEPFLRGMFVESSARVETIPYVRPERAAGTSNNNVFTLLDFMLSSLSGASKKMLRMPFYLGGALCVTGALLLVAAIVSKLLGGWALGWLIAAVVQVQFGVMFVVLGLVGDQIRLISERTRKTPLVIERERINFDEEH